MDTTRRQTSDPLEYYLYRPSESSSPILGPTSFINEGIQGSHRLPSTQGDGFAFHSGDNDRRWTLQVIMIW